MAGENLPAIAVSVSDMQTMAVAVAKSNLFGMKTPDQALALMLIAQAEGMHPAIAARDFHIIQGHPALKSDAMLARFQMAGGKVEWTCYTDSKVEGKFSHPAGGTVTIDWTMERAKAAGLGGKDNWKNYPRQMLRARVISEGIRTVFPGRVTGFYCPEEVQDFDAPKQPPMRDVAPPKEESSSTGNGNGSESPSPKELTIADIRKAAKYAIAKYGKEPVLEVLASNGWTKAEDIPSDKYAEAIAILEDM